MNSTKSIALTVVTLRSIARVRRLLAAALVAAFSLALPPLAAAAGAQEHPPEGQWEGAIRTPGSDLRFVVDLAPAEGGE